MLVGEYKRAPKDILRPTQHLRLCAGSITTAEGSALARLGDTTVVCGIKAEITEPDLARPEHGFIGEFDLHRLVRVLFTNLDNLSPKP